MDEKDQSQHELSKDIEIPLSLINDLDEKEKFLFQSVINLGKGNRRLEIVTNEQTKTLEKIYEQALLTNGRSLRNEENIKKINEKLENITPDIETVRTVKKVVKTKYFWVAMGVFVFGVIPFVSAEFPPQVVFTKVVSWVIK